MGLMEKLDQVDSFIGKKIKNAGKAISRTLAKRPLGEEITGSHGGSFNSGFGSTSNNFGSRSGGAKWSGGLSNSGRNLILDHRRLRQNARTAFHESLQARALIKRHTQTVIDTGLRLEPTPDFQILGISAEEAEEWGENVNKRFDLWAKSKKVDRTEKNNFYQMQKLYALSQQRDGEVFVRFSYSKKTDLLNPLQLVFLDPSQIRGDGLTSTLSPLGSHDGIQRDSSGRELSYEVWLRDLAKNEVKNVTIPAKGAKSGRTFMIHGFESDYAGQDRGFSEISHALQEFENLSDYQLSETMKAISQSQISMYVKPSPDDPSSKPFEQTIHQVAGPSAGFGTQSEPATNVASLDPIVNFCPLPEATLREPGSTGVFNLQGGEEIKPFQNTAPVAGFADFTDAVTSYISASMGMPIEVLKMKFGNNFSASRASLILYWRVAQIWRAETESDFLNPVYESWLSEEIARGSIRALGWKIPEMRAAWLSNNWIGSPMPNIDPQKTASATKINAELGLTTFDRESLNLNGSNGKSNRAKLARELSELPTDPYKKNGTR